MNKNNHFFVSSKEAFSEQFLKESLFFLVWRKLKKSKEAFME